MHTTNYINTFIQVAEDCPATIAEIPAIKGDSKTIATLHFEMMRDHPYKFRSDDIIFNVYAAKNNIPEKDLVKERGQFFSKGQACLRCSPLGKRYGWGIHHNEKGKVAIYAVNSAAYKKLATDKTLTQTKAMRTKKA